MGPLNILPGGLVTELLGKAEPLSQRDVEKLVTARITTQPARDTAAQRQSRRGEASPSTERISLSRRELQAHRRSIQKERSRN